MTSPSTVLIVPAGGTGSRLGSPAPKLLTPVAGRPMIDYLFDLYHEVADLMLFVVPPGFDSEVVGRGRARGISTESQVQESPTGMLDAILIPLARVRLLKPDWVWITWCDQVAVLPETVARLRELLSSSRPRMALATCSQPDPYIHFQRNHDGRIVRVLQRRERDEMPTAGESDAGLFALSLEAYTRHLPQYAQEAPRGTVTGERNFLPFVSWLAARYPDAVRTLDCRDPIESLGVNTPEDLARVETHLRARQFVVRPGSSS